MSSVRGVRRAREPVCVVMRTVCAGLTSAGSSSDFSVDVERGIVGVAGNNVIVLGKCPPREKVVRWSSSWPCRDLGSIYELVKLK